MFDFRRIFKPTAEERAADLEHIREIYEALYEERGCSTCRNCKRTYRCPGFVTGEECVCTAGLECDTVLFEIKNCEKYNRKEFNEFLYGEQK